MTLSITGCVNNPGEHKAPHKCVLKDAIEIAGGIRRDKEFKPTGIIALRKRISGSVSEKLKEINFFENPKALETEILESDSIIVIQIDGEHYEKHNNI